MIHSNCCLSLLFKLTCLVQVIRANVFFCVTAYKRDLAAGVLRVILKAAVKRVQAIFLCRGSKGAVTNLV